MIHSKISYMAERGRVLIFHRRPCKSKSLKIKAVCTTDITHIRLQVFKKYLQSKVVKNLLFLGFESYLLTNETVIFMKGKKIGLHK